MRKASWMCCVTLGNFPVLTGLERHHLCNEGHGSGILLGHPCLLHLTRMSSALPNTLILHSGLLSPPRLLQWPPAAFLSVTGTPTAHPPEPVQLATAQYPLAWCSRLLRVWPPVSGTKHAATPDPEDRRKRKEVKPKTGEETEAHMGQCCG